MKHLSLLLLSFGLLACSAEPTTGASAEELSFQVVTGDDAGPTTAYPTGITDLRGPLKKCWWDPDPKEHCYVPAGREPTCPTCCQNCGRVDWFGNQYAFIKANPELDTANLADHAVFSTSANPSGAAADHEYVDIEPTIVDSGYQAVQVPAQYAAEDEVYIYFVTDSDNSSYLAGASLIPKL